MRNFPINLLATTQTVIGKQDYQLRKYESRTKNAAGYFVSVFGEADNMAGSVQPIKATQYKSMGLDFKKAYIKIYDVNLINTLSRETNADQIIYDGYVWHVAEDTAWFLSGGWNYVMCVRMEKYNA
jgi:tartrate dehydratase beta subunit/fumarate hydratase class I family protein